MRPYLILLPALLVGAAFLLIYLSPLWPRLAYGQCVTSAIEAMAAECDVLPLPAVEAMCREATGYEP